jgi:hypothetical protein
MQNATAPVDLAKLTEAAQIADPAINMGQGRVDQFVNGVLRGAGIQAVNGPTMMARIGMLRALNRNVERVFDPSRKDKRWGKPKLKKEQ